MHESSESLERRRAELLGEVSDRLEEQHHPMRRSARPANPSRVQMRLLLIPAFAIFLFIQFGSRAGAPLGVHAAFTPGDGTSFAGPRVFRAGSTESMQLAPGDVVGARSGSGTTLELGAGRLALEAGARAAVASLMPPRVRLIGGRAHASGKLRVVTAHGILDLDDGSAELILGDEGLTVTLRLGEARLTSPDGEFELVPGKAHRSQ